MDDLAIGRLVRALRRRRGWRQSDLATRAGCSQALIAQLEAGVIDGTTLRSLRSVLAPLDVRAELNPRGRGADLERLLDEDHARLCSVAATRLEQHAWQARLEVTYSEYGERGSIDILGVLAPTRAVLVVEVKTELGSAEAIGRKLDEKARLAPRIVERLYGWRPAVVGTALVLPETSRLRRSLAATPALRRMFPDDPMRIRSWLRAPSSNLAVVWFLSDITGRDRTQGRRVRVRPRGPETPRGVASSNVIGHADQPTRAGQAP